MVKIKHLFFIIALWLSSFGFALAESNNTSSFSKEKRFLLTDKFQQENFSSFMIYLFQLNLYLTGFYEGEVKGEWNQETYLSMQKMVKENYNSNDILNSHFVSFQLENMAILDELEFFYLEDKNINTFIYMPKLLVEKMEEIKDGFYAIFVKEKEEDGSNPNMLFINSKNFNHDFYHAVTENKWSSDINGKITKETNSSEKITEFKTTEGDNILIKTFYYGSISETFIIESNTNENIVYNLFRKILTKNKFENFNYDKSFLDLIEQYKYEDSNVSKFNLHQEESEKSGTGFLINEKGEILTNYHVVNECHKVKIDGIEYQINTEDKENDLAVISPKNQKNIITHYASFSFTNPELNESITVSGFPLTGILGGLVVTNGNISSEYGLKGYDEHFMITAPIQSGNSGSPVFNHYGEVVGVVVAKMNDMATIQNLGELTQNINFAIDRDIVVKFFNDNGVRFHIGNRTTQTERELTNTVKRVTKRIDCF